MHLKDIVDANLAQNQRLAQYKQAFKDFALNFASGMEGNISPESSGRVPLPQNLGYLMTMMGPETATMYKALPGEKAFALPWKNVENFVKEISDMPNPRTGTGMNVLNVDPKKVKKVSDIVYHPESFKRAPYMKDIPFEFDPNYKMDAEMGAGIFEGKFGGKPGIVSKLPPDDPRFLEHLPEEYQHILNKKEFGLPENFLDPSSYNPNELKFQIGAARKKGKISDAAMEELITSDKRYLNDIDEKIAKKVSERRKMSQKTIDTGGAPFYDLTPAQKEAGEFLQGLKEKLKQQHLFNQKFFKQMKRNQINPYMEL